ncbi:acyltransferase [Roseiarcaceae bacterium H3SJ34-1]|uniref:acyltransferase family protein n=1 Tax=Terripilifer ovatus TaxID=3032367 RepID=UPI003AB94A22|nr:acyltransferase [Roseiarcaceae bacterium H3SJ34-1]
MTTIGGRLLLVENRPSGFDYMRLTLAIGVIAMHSVIVCYGLDAEMDFWKSAARPFIREILPAFFALSGFLVAGSLERSKTILMFLALRVIRIFPALSVEVLLSALIIGPIFTALSLSEYVSHPMFHKYFLNIVGDVQFHLPGVFASNPFPGVVNGQMWTVPYELYCYLTLAALACVRRKWAVPVAAVLISVMYAVYKVKTIGFVPVEVRGPIPGVLLLVCFLLGVATYLYRDVLPFSRVGTAICLLASMALLSVVPYGEYFAPWPIVYATVGIGLLNPKRTVVVDGADYSYGLFLYGYPIQQALAATGPWAQVWYINILATLVVGIVFAMFSWRVVEKPALNLRPLLRRLEDRYLAYRKAVAVPAR